MYRFFNIEIKHVVFLCAVLVAIGVIIGLGTFFDEREKFFEAEKKIGSLAVDLIKNGRYQEGIDICNDFSSKYFRTNYCHSYALGVKLRNNETITKEFCDSYHQQFKSDLPLTLKIFRLFERPNEEIEFMNSVYEQKNLCYFYVATELKSILLNDGVAHGQGIVIRIILINTLDRQFKEITPARIQLYTETSPNSKQKDKLVYDKTHMITEPSSTITILKEELNYTLSDKDTSMTVVQIEKQNGEIITAETSNLPIHLVLG